MENIKDMQLVKKGKCHPGKCKSACCKFYMIDNPQYGIRKYVAGFFENQNKYGDYYQVKNCKNLDVKNNKCRVWGTKDFPEVCKQFPNPTDAVYKHVFDVCGFHFKLQPREPIFLDKIESE